MTEIIIRRFRGRGTRMHPDSLFHSFSCLRPSPVRAYTDHIGGLLNLIYCNPPYQVKAEWRPMLREEVRTRRPRARRIMYSPAIDLAVGPFATHRRYVDEYDLMVNRSADLLHELLRCFRRNLRSFESYFTAPTFDQLCNLNPNSRCFLAIEIEKGNPSMKYLMGTTFNASSLSRVGIVVAWDRNRLRDLLSAREYFLNLDNWGKNSFNTNNLIFLERSQLTRTLERASRGHQAER